MKKHLFAYAIMLAALAFAFVAFRRYPSALKQVVNSATPENAAQSYVINLAGYTPRDYSLPSLGGTSITMNRYSNCSFCLRSRSQGVTPSDAIQLPNPQELITVSYVDDPQPFGGSGG